MTDKTDLRTQCALLSSALANAWSLTCLGALEHDLLHESQNLVTVALGWTYFVKDDDFASLKPLLDKAAKALRRLATLNGSIALCASPQNTFPSGDTLATLVGYAVSVTGPRLRLAGIDLTTDLPDITLKTTTRPLVLACALLLRHAVEETARVKQRSIRLLGRPIAIKGQTFAEVEISFLGTSPAFPLVSPDPSDPLRIDLWSGMGLATAHYWLSHTGCTLRYQQQESEVSCVVLIPCH